MEKPLRLPTGDLTGTLREALGVFLERHFPGTRIDRELERVRNITETGANGQTGSMEDRVRRTVITLIPNKAPGPDGMYMICLQKGLDLMIKYLIKICRCSVEIMNYILKTWRDVRMVLIPIP